MSKYGNIKITRREPALSSAGSKNPAAPPKKLFRLRFDDDGEICSLSRISEGAPESDAIGKGWTFDEVVANGKYDPTRMVESGLKLVSLGLSEVEELKALASKDPGILPAIAKREGLSIEHVRVLSLAQRLWPTTSIEHWMGVIQEQKLTPDEMGAKLFSEESAAGGREEPAKASV